MGAAHSHLPEAGCMGRQPITPPFNYIQMGVKSVDIIIMHKIAFSTGEFRGVKNIAYDPVTMMYTITKSDNTTVQYSSTTYYLQFIWG